MIGKDVPIEEAMAEGITGEVAPADSAYAKLFPGRPLPGSPEHLEALRRLNNSPCFAESNRRAEEERAWAERSKGSTRLVGQTPPRLRRKGVRR